MLIRSYSAADIDVLNEDVEYAGSKPAGGTIMGIHNLAIVFPQFLIAIIASFIFKMSEATAGNEGSPGGAAQEQSRCRSCPAIWRMYGTCRCAHLSKGTTHEDREGNAAEVGGDPRGEWE